MLAERDNGCDHFRGRVGDRERRLAIGLGRRWALRAYSEQP
jgi:hypothetical protein